MAGLQPMTAAPPAALVGTMRRGAARGWSGWALPVVLVGAAANFLWQLGSSSYFVDEALSVSHASHSLSGVISVVRMTETTPPTFFLFLHEWLYRTGSQAEWFARLPSAIAGVALVGAVYWMARAFIDRGAALAAAGLCALSPLILEYAQQVRVYVFVMLAVTLSVGATVRAVSSTGYRRQLLVAGTLLGAISLWLHYTAALVILPLCVWVGTRSGLSRRARIGFIGTCLLAGVVLIPFFRDQYNYAPNGGLVGIATLTLTNIVKVAATPFDGRSVGGVDVIRLFGVAVTVAALVALTFSHRRKVRHARLMVTLGLFPLLAIVLIAAAGKDVVLTRYTALAAPFLLTAMAAASTMVRRPIGAALLAVAVLVAATGLVRSHRETGFYAPAREAIAYIAKHRGPRDAVITPGGPGADIPLAYYAPLRFHPLPHYVAGNDRKGLLSIIAQREPFWAIREMPNNHYSDSALLQLANSFYRTVHYRTVRVHVITTATTFALYRVVPSPG